MSSDADAASLPVVRAQCSAQCVSISLAGKHVYKNKPRDLFIIVVINAKKFKVVKAAMFNIHKVSSAKGMLNFITAVDKDDIVVVAGTERSIRSKRSQTVVDVFRSLRSIGGSLHMMDCPYCLLYTSPSPRDRQKSRMPSSA